MSFGDEIIHQENFIRANSAATGSTRHRSRLGCCAGPVAARITLSVSQDFQNASKRPLGWVDRTHRVVLVGLPDVACIEAADATL